ESARAAVCRPDAGHQPLPAAVLVRLLCVGVLPRGSSYRSSGGAAHQYELYGRASSGKTSPEYRPRIDVSVPQMVRMSLQDGEPTIELLEQKDTRQFMGHRHLPQRKREISLLAGGFAEPIGRTNAKYQRNRVRVLMIA